MAKLTGEELRRTRTADEDDLPGPDLVAEPAAQGRRHHRRGPAHLEGRHRGRAAEEDRRHDARGRSRPGAAARPASAPVLRRSVPAHLDRPCRHHRAEADHLRRAGLGARRVGAGADPEPARGDEDALRAHADLHRARPRGREERERPRRRDVPRQDLRGRFARRRSTSSPRTRTRACCSTRSRCPIRASGPRRAPRSSARSRRRSRRRRAAGSARAARRPRPSAPTRSPQVREISAGQFVACHFPLAPGETLPTTQRQPPRYLDPAAPACDRCAQLRGQAEDASGRRCSCSPAWCRPRS